MNSKKIMLSMFKSKIFYAAIGLLLVLFLFDLIGIKVGVSQIDSDASLGLTAIDSASFQFISMLKVVPPIFLLIGLLDVWVPKATMIKYMGKDSGLKGVAIALFIGTMSAGPLIAAFPVAQTMLKKGAKYSNVLFFLTIWASTKLPILFYQATTLGIEYTIVTNITLLIVYFFGTLVIEKLLNKQEIAKIYQVAEAS